MINGSFDPFDFSHFEDQFARRAVERRENLILRFFKQAVPNAVKSQEAGREICDQVDYVSIIVPGSKDEVIEKVGESQKKRFAAQYEHWLKTQEQPPEGQPLDRVPWLNVAQIRELQYLNIKTLEQLAGLSDTAIQHIGMGGRDLRSKAQAYIEAGKGTAELSRLVARISELERDNARLQDDLKAVNARYEVVLKKSQDEALAAPPPPPEPAVPAVDITALIRAEVAKMMKGD